MKDPVQVRKSPVNLHTLRCVPDIYRDLNVTKKFIEAIESDVFITGYPNRFKLSYVIIGPLKRKDYVSTGIYCLSEVFACAGCYCDALGLTQSRSYSRKHLSSGLMKGQLY